MIVGDAIPDGEKIAETLARLGRRLARFNVQPKSRQSTGELAFQADGNNLYGPRRRPLIPEMGKSVLPES